MALTVQDSCKYFFNLIINLYQEIQKIKSNFLIEKKKILNKNYLIFWKGHVAIRINKNLLIHAYGPKKRVLIMDIKKTINEIRQNANLEVITKYKN